MNQKLPLDKKDDQRQSADADEHLVTTVVPRRVVGTVDLRRNNGTYLDNNVICGSGYGTLLDVEGVLRNPRGYNGMEVGISGDERRNGEAGPAVATGGQSEQSSQKRQAEELSKETMERPLVEELAALYQSNHKDDLANGRWDQEHVRVERGETKTLESERQITLNWRRRNIGNKTYEVEAPHAGIFPRLEDILHRRWLVEVGKTFGRVVTKNAVDHDALLPISVPRLAEQNTLGTRGSER